MSIVKQTLEDLKNGCEVTIVCFGDSITAGYGVRKGFPYFWREMLQQKYPEARIKLINSGIAGDTTADGMVRLDWAVLSYRPDLVTVNFGINDALMGIGLYEFKSNLKNIVQDILYGPGSEVLLLSSQPLETPTYDELVVQYYKKIADVANDMEIGFVDVYKAWKKRIKDGIPLSKLILPRLDHPNEAGYKIIAEELMNFF
ncbi:MAG: GDSL-type esterase/lipase family protein [Methanotrichaceae archaeon]|nr:GDSL-type esterase/lipase family protein [Methanotrichaceae archaeon]